MIVNEEEALLRLTSKENLTYKLRALHTNRTGSKGIPPMVTALAITTATLSGDQESAAKSFGMTQENLSQMKNHSPNVELQSLIKKNIDSVHEKALDGMLACLDSMKDKIPNVKKATELSTIASNLARVVEKTSPKENNHHTNVQIIVHQPRTHGEDEYESISV